MKKSSHLTVPGGVPDNTVLVSRRTAVVAGGLAMMIGRDVAAQPSPESHKRPQKNDKLVFVSGPREGKEIAPDDLPSGGPQVLAWAADPKSGIARDGSRLNQILLVRLAEDVLSQVTRQRAAAGVVAYSAICSHAQCPVTEWNNETNSLHCACHNSEYDPRENAKVVNGPAPRALASLPLALNDGLLVVAGPFIGKIGAPTA